MKQILLIKYSFWFISALIFSNVYSQLPKACMEQKPAAKTKKAIAPAFIIGDEEGPHSSAMEGWYYYGYLKSEDSLDDEWLVFASFQRTIFGRYLIYNLIDLKTGGKKFFGFLDNPTGLVKLPPSHFSFKKTEKKFRPDSPVFDLSWEGNIFKKDQKHYRTFLINPEFSLQLDLTSVKIPMHVLGTGLTGLTKPENLHYYAYPELAATGRLFSDSSEKKICGEFWHEHIWGSIWPPKLVKWTWWSLQLETGEAMTVSLIKNRSDKILQNYISLQDNYGKTMVFDTLQFEILQHWVSEKSFINYPVKWKIKIPQWDHDLIISPLFIDSEIPVFGTKFLWEGPCIVEAVDRKTGRIVKGKGIQENVGYEKK